uniref:NADH-ubiquinone oxidoreductase chain 3 n=1 Tax=Sphaeriusidae sp. BMNH 703456 TaxID=1903818 RepID=A0A343A3G5_9COLE|nr:NADH dehydrogenase subunit 3 [Sphaeriusidae sp. BMNH 703456]
MILMMILLLLISSMVMILATLISKKTFLDREKNSPFECGFDPTSSSRIPFSLQFFLIAVMFLIFDVEIALLLPIILTLTFSSMMNWLILSFMFLIILLLGLYHEWNQESLNWI